MCVRCARADDQAGSKTVSIFTNNKMYVHVYSGNTYIVDIDSAEGDLSKS